jgi:hypothetical protein
MQQLGIRTVAEFLATPKQQVLSISGVGPRTFERIVDAIERTRPAPDTLPPLSLLPDSLRQLELRHAPLPPALLPPFADLGCTTVGHALSLPAAVYGERGGLGPRAAAALRTAVDQLLRPALQQLDTRPPVDELDWPTLRGRLLAPLDEDERQLLCQRIGLGVPARSARQQAALSGEPLEAVQPKEETVRQRLRERAPSLLARLRHEVGREFEACDGIVRADRLPVGTLLHAAAKGSGDPGLPLRLAAFCFPDQFHGHGRWLSTLPARTMARLLQKLRMLTTPRLLPRTLASLVEHLRAVADHVPRGALLYLLADSCRVRVHADPERGEVVLPQQTTPSARLAEILAEEGQPTPFLDLLFHYRERFRAANPQRLQSSLRADPAFLEIGPGLWSLRAWHPDELAAAQPRAEEIVRAVNEQGGRHHVADLLPADDARTACLVLDLVRRDRRLRYLGRGDVCPAGHTRSLALENLLRDFRRAAGEVVYGRFVENQPEGSRRLVRRLLDHNRLFVFPSPDRIDVLTNYPFNDERLRRLVALVDGFLAERNGYAPLQTVLDEVNRCDLGGGWLTPTLLGELLRRHGPFEVLPGCWVARAALRLGTWLLRRARNALREANVAISLQEILVERPELSEFAGCLEGLLQQDPLVQTPDGMRFQIA